MHILVDRFLSDNDTTISIIYVDGKFECFGLEDEYREEKVPGDTRIPAGYYTLGLRTVGGFDSRYHTKFGAMHQGMLEVQNVENFEYVLIHIGNDEGDTAGCLLVGTYPTITNELRLVDSTTAYKKLYQKVIAAVKQGHCTIEYKDNDREAGDE